ncbi:hypothetical protein [Halioxenophilus aromaticivorans]|uniref:Secreted protein n=1 Tax=Halioxenophilus aromaticivorans TaxID=1306992 RepID=A0AAV3TZ85_9ALTE
MCQINVRVTLVVFPFVELFVLALPAKSGGRNPAIIRVNLHISALVALGVNGYTLSRIFCDLCTVYYDIGAVHPKALWQGTV